MKSSMPGIHHLLCSLAILAIVVGCGRSPQSDADAPRVATRTSSGEASMAVPTLPEAPLVQTSFQEVANHLNAGGSFYMYMSTEKVMSKLTDLTHLVESFASEAMPDVAVDRRQLSSGIQLLRRFIDTSGLKEINAIGASSFTMADAITHTRFMIYRKPGQSDGKLWQMLGGESRKLDTLAMMPADTAFAAYADFDVNLTYAWIRGTLGNSDSPEVQQALDNFDMQLQMAGINLDELLAATDGGFGFALQLSQSQTLQLPIGQTGMQVPKPGFFLFTKVKDDALFKRADALATAQASGARMPLARDTTADYQMLMLGAPIPFVPGNIQPALLQHQGYLMIGSSPDILKSVISARNGKDTLQQTAEYQRLARHMPDSGNQWIFVSQRLVKLANEVKEQVLDMQAQSAPPVGHEPPAARSWQDMMDSFNHQAATLAVVQVTDEGIIGYTNTQLE